jgi:Tol biopolymer transport system component
LGEERTPTNEGPSPLPAGHGELIAFAVIGNGSRASRPASGSAIAVVRADGSGFRFVTQASTTSSDLTADPWIQRYGFAGDASPVWSRDGSTIAFIRSYAEGIDSLCSIGVDGRNFHVVVRNLHGGELSWSPDGSMFAFYSEQDGGIHVMDADGSHEHAVAPEHTQNQDFPSWSPDGAWLYFAQGNVFAVHPDGTALHEVANPSWFVGSADLSPDGTTIVLQRQVASSLAVIGSAWLVDADGSDLRRLTSGDGVDWSPLGWSADSSRVLLARPGPNDTPELWTIETNGTDLKRIELPDGVGPYGAVSSRAPSG